MKGSRLLWKIPLVATCTALGLVLLLLIAVGCVLYVPSLRKAALDKGVAIAREKTGMDIEVGDLSLIIGDSTSSQASSPFVLHVSPVNIYRAYKGQGDLPVVVGIDSLFVGHRGQDTLLCVQRLRLNATMHNSQCTIHNSQFLSPKGNDYLTESNFHNFSEITSIPIEVEQLLLDEAAFHSDTLIKTTGVDVTVGHLEVASPALNIADGRYPLHGLRLEDVYCGIDLRKDPKAKSDSAKQQKKPLRLCFELPDGELRNIHFALTPLDLHVRTGSLSTEATVDVGTNCYTTRRLEVGRFALDLRQLHIPVDTIYGTACADIQRNRITSEGLHVRSDEWGAQADLSATAMDLKSMRLDVSADASYHGSRAQVRGYYDIDDEAYDATVHVERVDLRALIQDSTPLVLAGEVEASGRGVRPSRPMQSSVRVRLDEARYGIWNLSGTRLEASTDSMVALDVDAPHLAVRAASPMPLMTLIERIKPMVATVSDSAVLASITSLSDLTALDTIRRSLPAIEVAATMHKGSPLQPLIDRSGVEIDEAHLSLRSDSLRTDLTADATLPQTENPDDATALRLPAIRGGVRVGMTEGHTEATVEAATRLTDGLMAVEGICTDAAFRMAVQREGKLLHGDGRLTLDSLAYGEMALGNRAIDMHLTTSRTYANALRVDVQSEDIPLDIVDGLISSSDLALHGAVRMSASVDGLPRKADVSAEVLPLGVRAEYKPYKIAASLGETSIVMKHNKVDLNGLAVYGVDSTYLTLSGGLDLNRMRMDMTLQADSFAPVKLVKDGPIPLYGELATDLRGTLTGPLDKLVADVDVTILPTTDITYPIDKKNLAQVKPHGTVNVRYAMADTMPLSLGGQINVDDGMVRYSPKMYPIMPFRVDSGSHVSFHGPAGKTRLDISASQKVKSDVKSEDEETRRVDFTTGVRVNGVVDSIGLHSIYFFLEAPEDETITRELEAADEETREGLAATLLATGMYVGESNVAAQQDGYALSSIVNSRINAAMANSKIGKVVDVDLSSAQTVHLGGTTNDVNVAISRSFFKKRLRVTLGSTFTDDPEINKTSGLLNSLSAEYKLTKQGNVLLRVFSQRDYNNVLEGELYKYGLGVRATKDWRRREAYRGDTLLRTYNLTADAGVAYRSNNSIGPDLTIKSSIKNLFGRDETFAIKANGAYYWGIRNRHPGDPKKTDTYKLGVATALVFPYLHWTGKNIPEGTTRYILGYQYENIAGGYGVHKLSSGFTYHIRSSEFITHSFTPFSLSVVLMKAESDSLMDKAADYPQLIKLYAGNEFVPSISYNFTYSDYRTTRPVNTMVELGVKESGNLVYALYRLFGRGLDENGNPTSAAQFNQYVKLTAELRNRYNITDRICIATRLFAGANIPLGFSKDAPLSEAFYAGGGSGMRAASPSSYGPGNFYSPRYNQSFFHAGDVKLEANFEFRFPIVWKLYGAAFLDAGNVWNWRSAKDRYDEETYKEIVEKMELLNDVYDGILNNPDVLSQIALGTGAGLRLDLDGLVLRMDIGVAIHAPYQTYRKDKDGNLDKSQPITTYFNIPSAMDALRFNFGIGYPF